jgi:gliding motility-associated-like protein
MQKTVGPTLLCLILLLGHPVWSQSNEGTEFWFAFMEHRDIGQNTMVAMITSKYNTAGTIRIPGHNWSRSFAVAANQVEIIQLPSYAETLGSETVLRNGVSIFSDQPVSVYIHQYFAARSEASVVLPKESLGKEYYVLSHYGVNRQGVDYPSEFIIVGMEDETEVNIKVSDRTKRGKNANTTFSVMLDAGETYQVQAALGSDDLTGSYIIADKKINVLAGNRWTDVPLNCGARDNLLEQMPPVETWGRRFVTVLSSNVSFDFFRILASEDGTVVNVEGSITETYDLNAGEFIEYRKSESTFVNSNKPIAVAQFMVGSECSGHRLGDPSMVILNSIEQTRDTVTLFNSSFENISENYINIVTRTADAEYVLFDGRKLVDQGTTFTPVGAGGLYAYARLRVSVGAHTIISEGCGVIATAYGYGEVESYAYGGGASFSPINASPLPEGGCLNDTVFFDSGLPPNRYDILWRLHDGTTSDQHQFGHIYRELGAFPASAIVRDLCLGEVDTVFEELEITLRQAVDATPDVLVCEGEPVSLGATDLAGARYEWRGPNGYFSDRQFPTLNNTRSIQSGPYAVVGIVSGCATYPAITNVEIIATPEPELGESEIICPQDEDFQWVLDPGEFTSYRWQDNSTSSAYQVVDGGVFSVEVTDEYGCVGRDSVELIRQCPTKIYAPTAFSPNGDGSNDDFMVLGSDIISIRLLIYDRWGNQVFESSDPQLAWDGKFSGQPAPAGVYIWTATIEGYKRDGSVYIFQESGSVALMR